MTARIFILFLGDFMLALVALRAVFFIHSRLHETAGDFFSAAGAPLAFMVLVVLSFSFFLDLYHQDKQFRPIELLLRVSSADMLSLISLLLVFSAIPVFSVDRTALFWFFAVFSVLHALWHIGFQMLRNISSFARRVLIVGTGPLATRIGEMIASNNHHYELAGYIPCSETEHPHISRNGNAISEAVKMDRPRKIVVSLSERRGSFPMHDLLACKLSGIEILDAPSFYEQMTRKILVENITPSWFIFSNGFRIHSVTKILKRVLDVILAGVALVLTFPLFLFVALLIKIDSAGPVFFQQTRVGENERDFTVYKFRTMARNAEEATGAVWAQENDPRVTRVGRFLRKIRIDELPQFYNVLIGDMSLVGPRPERPEFVSTLKEAIPYYSARHIVKPGITGWAQVNYPYGASVEDAREKLRYDLFYIKHRSFSFDLLILLETIKVVVIGRGGR